MRRVDFIVSFATYNFGSTMWRRLFKSAFIQHLLSWLAATYIRMVFYTSRFSHQGENHLIDALQHGAVIVAFWHGRLLMMPYGWRYRGRIWMLSSSHRDGMLVARAVNRLGVSTIYGSTSKNGSGAVRAMLRVLRQGDAIGINPDGPRGPAEEVSMGVIHLAALSGAPIVPCGYSARKAKRLKTWDRFILPFPFTRGVFVWGEPIYVSGRDTTVIAAAQQRLQTSLDNLGQLADTAVGVSWD